MMSAPPQNPAPAHIQADSMLARRFGKETVNYFSSSPLNRLSFLRTEHQFLSAALKHPSTRFVLLKELTPLTHNPADLYLAKYNEVKKLVAPDFYDRSEEEAIKEYDSRVTIPQLIFLGLDEEAAAAKGQDTSKTTVTGGAATTATPTQDEHAMTWKIYRGIPYFALDVTPRGNPEQEVYCKELIGTFEGRGLEFYKARIHMTLPADQAAIYAQARALMDWNTRNTFCGTCGHTTLSVNAGTKRACPPTDKALAASSKNPNQKSIERPPCSTRTTLSNLSFPRTDPTIIVAVLSTDGKRILLGRSKRFPPNWYSTLAGFIEPAESIEDAVRREVWEEAGVTLSRVVIHSSQPWPYPANLMIGAIAQVSDPAHETISLAHDPELEDAKWFEIAEVEEALRVGTSDLGGKPGNDYKEGGLRLPPSTAIANQLIQAAVSKNYLSDAALGIAPGAGAGEKEKDFARI